MDKFEKKESYLHDSAKIVFVEGICGRSYKEGLLYPSDISIYAKGLNVSSQPNVGSCDVSWNITLEKEIFIIDESTGKSYRSFVPDIYIYDESINDILLVEVIHTSPITNEKLIEINKWILATKKTPYCGDIRVFEVPAVDILKIDKYSHNKDSHAWKFPIKFLDKYEL